MSLSLFVACSSDELGNTSIRTEQTRTANPTVVEVNLSAFVPQEDAQQARALNFNVEAGTYRPLLNYNAGDKLTLKCFFRLADDASSLVVRDLEFEVSEETDGTKIIRGGGTIKLPYSTSSGTWYVAAISEGTYHESSKQLQFSADANPEALTAGAKSLNLPFGFAWTALNTSAAGLISNDTPVELKLQGALFKVALSNKTSQVAAVSKFHFDSNVLGFTGYFAPAKSSITAGENLAYVATDADNLGFRKFTLNLPREQSVATQTTSSYYYLWAMPQDAAGSRPAHSVVSIDGKVNVDWAVKTAGTNVVTDKMVYGADTKPEAGKMYTITGQLWRPKLPAEYLYNYSNATKKTNWTGFLGTDTDKSAKIANGYSQLRKAEFPVNSNYDTFNARVAPENYRIHRMGNEASVIYPFWAPDVSESIWGNFDWLNTSDNSWLFYRKVSGTNASLRYGFIYRDKAPANSVSKQKYLQIFREEKVSKNGVNYVRMRLRHVGPMVAGLITADDNARKELIGAKYFVESYWTQEDPQELVVNIPFYGGGVGFRTEFPGVSQDPLTEGQSFGLLWAHRDNPTNWEGAYITWANGAASAKFVNKSTLSEKKWGSNTTIFYLLEKNAQAQD